MSKCFFWIYLSLYFEITFSEILLKERKKHSVSHCCFVVVYLFVLKDPVKFQEQILYGKLMKLLDEASKIIDSQGKYIYIDIYNITCIKEDNILLRLNERGESGNSSLWAQKEKKDSDFTVRLWGLFPQMLLFWVSFMWF